MRYVPAAIQGGHASVPLSSASEQLGTSSLARRDLPSNSVHRPHNKSLRAPHWVRVAASLWGPCVPAPQTAPGKSALSRFPPLRCTFSWVGTHCPRHTSLPGCALFSPTTVAYWLRTRSPRPGQSYRLANCKHRHRSGRFELDQRCACADASFFYHDP